MSTNEIVKVKFTGIAAWAAWTQTILNMSCLIMLPIYLTAALFMLSSTVR
jgi:uncharacterized membrane protein YtjA (UPF0391 family)